MGRSARSLARALPIFCALVLAGCSSFEPGRVASRGPQAIDGILDLRFWDFEGQGAVSLGGTWDFAPAVLLDSYTASAFRGWTKRQVPDFWKGGEGGDRPGTGCGTYRLRILLPKDSPNLAVRNYTGYNAFELEANGAVVARAGVPGRERASARSAYNPGVNLVRPASFGYPRTENTSSRELTLLFRISNWDYRGGGIWKCLVLGDSSALAAEERKDGNAEIALAAIMAALALNSLIIFANRRKERSYLFFGLFGLVLALRPLVTGEYEMIRFFPGMGFDLLVRLEYASAMLAVPGAIAFFLSFFPSGETRFWSAVLIGPFAPFWLCVLFLPMYWLTWTIFPFYALSLVAIVAASSVVLARAVYRRTQGGLPMFVGGCLLVLAAVNDVMYSSHLVQTASIFPFALVFFIFLQSSVLARRYTSAFERIETLSLELKESNGLLRDEIRNAMDASARLEESLAEKEVLLKEVHHRVKNSLQIVSSIAALQANRTDDAAATELARSIRDRIRVISLANEKLYDIESGDKIDLVDYARDVLRLAVSSYDSEGCRIEADVAGGRVLADPAVAIDFGLILTELVVNSLKHALLPRGGGRIAVSIESSGGQCSFEIRDDGPGFPETFDPVQARSLGFKIIMALLKRRRGSIAITQGGEPAVTCSMLIETEERGLLTRTR